MPYPTRRVSSALRAACVVSAAVTASLVPATANAHSMAGLQGLYYLALALLASLLVGLAQGIPARLLCRASSERRSWKTAFGAFGLLLMLPALVAVGFGLFLGVVVLQQDASNPIPLLVCLVPLGAVAWCVYANIRLLRWNLRQEQPAV